MEIFFLFVLENFASDLDTYALYETLHDKTQILSPSFNEFNMQQQEKLQYGKNQNNLINAFEKQHNIVTHQSYFQKKILEQHFFYSGKLLKSEKRYNLGKA
jgi:hypothetical protein